MPRRVHHPAQWVAQRHAESSAWRYMHDRHQLTLAGRIASHANPVLWNQFLPPIALNTKPSNADQQRRPSNYVLTQGMAEFESQAGYAVDFGALFAAVVITVAPVLVVYIIFQRQLRGSVVAGAVK